MLAKGTLWLLTASLWQLCQCTFLPTYLDSAAPTYSVTEEGVGHFSEWSKSTKRDFVDDVRAGNAHEWVIVMGNEGGGECKM
jgi:hypothetical protein